MSRLLEGALGDERRLECVRNDAKLIAAATAPGGKALILDRRIPFHADAIDSFDAVITGIDAGAQRVEVFPLVPDVDAMRAAGAL